LKHKSSPSRMRQPRLRLLRRAIHSRRLPSRMHLPIVRSRRAGPAARGSPLPREPQAQPPRRPTVSLPSHGQENYPPTISDGLSAAKPIPVLGVRVASASPKLARPRDPSFLFPRFGLGTLHGTTSPQSPALWSRLFCKRLRKSRGLPFNRSRDVIAHLIHAAPRKL
jgi:hypothetical protein